MIFETRIIAFLAASLVRPFVLALAAWLTLRIFRLRHPASRHAVWTAVLIGMFLLPFFSAGLPQWKLPLLPGRPKPLVHISPEPAESAAFGYSEPFGSAHNPGPPETPVNTNIELLILWLYLAGFLALTSWRVLGWILLWRVMSRSRRLRMRPLWVSPDAVTPLTARILRPAVILPLDWRSWAPATRRAVLAHEFAHIRRRDGLVSALAHAATCVFWFHPLAWWLSRELSECAELACDAVAIEQIDDPAGYARVLLDFSRAVNRAGSRIAVPGLAMVGLAMVDLAMVGLAMVTRSAIARRIDQAFEISNSTARRLTRPVLLIGVVGAPVLCLAAIVGVGPHAAPSPNPLLLAPASRVPPRVELAEAQLAQVQPPAQPPRQASRAAELQPLAAPPQTFEVASVKPVGSISNAGQFSNGCDGSFPRLDNNRFAVTTTLYALITWAYGFNRQWGCSFVSLGDLLSGGPAWVRSDRFEIQALMPEGSPRYTLAQFMKGDAPQLEAMIRTLLADRFQLVLHREMKQVPAYALTRGKGALKLMQSKDDDEPMFGWPRVSNPNGQISRKITGRKASMRDLAFLLLLATGRPVIDQTGITGDYNFDFLFAPLDDNSSVDTAAPSIFTAVQELGLKLEAAKTPLNGMVIDSVEKPSGN
jgi:bla regulator protein blaR1